MQIRPATVDDARPMAEVQVSSWRAAYAGIVPQPFLDGLSIDERAAVCAHYLSGSGSTFLGSYVAVEDDVVIGFVSWSSSRDQDATPTTTAEVASCYVAPRAWRTGAGQRLIQPGLDRLPAKGYTSATLWVLAANDRARRFYEATGWTPDGTTKVEAIGGTRLEELRYEHALKA